MNFVLLFIIIIVITIIVISVYYSTQKFTNIKFLQTLTLPLMKNQKSSVPPITANYMSNEESSSSEEESTSSEEETQNKNGRMKLVKIKQSFY